MITFKEFFEQAASSTDKPLAPVVFGGWQEAPESATSDVMVKHELFNTTVPIPALGKVAATYAGFTVGRQTLENLGYYVPQVPPTAKPGDPVVDDRVKTEAQTKQNPFGFKRRKDLKPNQGQKRLPPKVYKGEMKAKQNKKDLLKPRRWQVNTAGKLIALFR